jgi:hypothetical protein
MKKVLGILVALGLLAAPVAFAKQEGPGCGLGAKVWTGQKGMITHLSAATTNNLISPQTSAITSGTSGCDSDTTVWQDQQQRVFVAANLGSLSQDMAQGHGQYLNALAGLMGCPTSARRFPNGTTRAGTTCHPLVNS